MRRLMETVQNSNRDGYKVSIITVSYNSVKTIEQTIQSVLRQSYKNIEYIIIDGASTDGTQQVIEKYIGYLEYYISEEDNGLYYAMNKGIKKATGNIIGIINSDDWYADDSIQNIVQCFELNQDVDLVYGKVVIVNEYDQKKINVPQPLDNIRWTLPIDHPSVFVKKSIYEKYGVFDTQYRIASDRELLLRFYLNNVRFVYIDKIITYFREGGISTREVKKAVEEDFKISCRYAPDKEEITNKIEEMYEWGNFISEMLLCEGFLSERLNCYFSENIKEIVIFGIGTWGEKCYKAIKNTEITVLYFSDNNQDKWNTEFQGIKVIEPKKLKKMDVFVLIAVKEHGDEIKECLADMKNEMLKIVSIGELKTLFCQNEISMNCQN